MAASKEEENSSVPIPEEFQREVSKLLDGATEEQLQYVQSCCSKCLYPKPEVASTSKKEDDFSDKDMPKD